MKKGTGIVLVMLVGFLFSETIGLPASDFPTRPIDAVIPYTPGGGMDFLFDAFKEKAEKILGQPFLRVYKPGAGGGIGAAYVAKSKPDGYTLLVGGTSYMVVFPLTTKDIGYTINDFTPICNLADQPQIFCVKEDSPYKTFQDFIKAAKTKKITYSSHGNLTLAHINMMAVAKASGFQATHIPFPGAVQAMTAAMGGHVDISVTGSTGGLVGPGRLRVLAIAYEKRVDFLPNAPTLKELGFPNSPYPLDTLWAPKGTPKENIEKIFQAFKTVAEKNREEIKKKLEDANLVLNFMGPQEMMESTQEQYGVVRKILEEMGVAIK